MTKREFHRVTALAVAALFIVALGNRFLRGDEPSRLGRLFRFGGTPSSAAASPTSGAAPAPVPDPVVPSLSPAAPLADSVAPVPSGPTNRIIPQPRNYRGVTDSDPLVTRVTLARTSEGSSFGMFLQVFADGTVIDSEGVHQLGREGIKSLLGVLNSDELYRLKGHCGAPPTDFIEDVHVIVYERSLRGLRANAFSYSGNPQGCDPAVRRLQGVLDTIQASYTRPPTTVAPSSEGPPSTPGGREIRLNEGNGRP